MNTATMPKGTARRFRKSSAQQNQEAKPQEETTGFDQGELMQSHLFDDSCRFQFPGSVKFANCWFITAVGVGIEFFNSNSEF